MPKPALRALDLARSIPWAILEPDLQRILAIAQRTLDVDLKAIERELGHELRNTARVTIRNGVAHVPVTGPLFRYANLLTRISGATSLELLARDFSAAVADPEVAAIVLAIDSPGGEVNGTSELAQLVHDARGPKPIVAHVSGMGASGAYWLAAAADEVVATDTALVGSVGAVIEVVDFREGDAAAGVRTFTFVSSVSPRKHADPGTETGAAEFQRIVDRLGEVFVATVARYRAVSVEDVRARYGQGAILVGQEAVDAGLVDRLATLEQLHGELATDRPGLGGMVSPRLLQIRAAIRAIEQGQLVQLDGLDMGASWLPELLIEERLLSVKARIQTGQLAGAERAALEGVGRRLEAAHAEAQRGHGADQVVHRRYADLMLQQAKRN